MGWVYIILCAAVAVLCAVTLWKGIRKDASLFLGATETMRSLPKKAVRVAACLGVVAGTALPTGMYTVSTLRFIFPMEFTLGKVMLTLSCVLLSYAVLLGTLSRNRIPFSNTVMMISCLLGASLGTVLPGGGSGLPAAINFGGIFMVVSTVLVSFMAAFILGAAVMYLSRLIFSFRYRRTWQRWGALWIAVMIAIPADIMCGILCGSRGTGAMAEAVRAMTETLGGGGLRFLALLAAAWAVIRAVQAAGAGLLATGTVCAAFLIACAFSCNDVSFFAGVPISFGRAFSAYMAGGLADAPAEILTQPLATGAVTLIAIGLLLAVSIISTHANSRSMWLDEVAFSGKSGSSDKFGATSLSRTLVAASFHWKDAILDMIPSRVRTAMQSRFQVPIYQNDDDDVYTYNLIRVMANMFCAAMLIMTAARLRLPMSSTNTIFLVALGTALADHTWSRDNAVGRFTAVMTLLTSWFLTALGACVLSFIIALLATWMGVAAAVALSLALTAVYAVYRSRHGQDPVIPKHDSDMSDVMSVTVESICAMLARTTDLYRRIITAILKEDRKGLKEALRQTNDIYYEAREEKYEILPNLQRFNREYPDSGQYYVQVIDYMNEMAKAMLHISRQCFEHVDQHQRNLSEEQVSDLLSINGDVSVLFDSIDSMLRSGDFSGSEQLGTMRDNILEIISQAVRNQLRRVQMGSSESKSSVLYLLILNETKTIVLQARNLVKTLSYFNKTVRVE